MSSKFWPPSLHWQRCLFPRVVFDGFVVGHRDVFASGVILQELEAFFCKFSLTFTSMTTPVQVDVTQTFQRRPQGLSPQIALKDSKFWRSASRMRGWCLAFFWVWTKHGLHHGLPYGLPVVRFSKTLKNSSTCRTWKLA